jgi:hypothetical protein
MFPKDKDLIKKLELHSKGEYKQFSQGDIEYLILTIRRCAQLEYENS